MKNLALLPPGKFLSYLPLALSLSSALAQPADRIEFAPVQPEVTSGEAFSIAFRLLANDGSQATNWQGQVRLQAFSAAAAPVISEVDAIREAIEITNPGTDALDLTDWEIRFFSYGGEGTISQLVRLRLPAGSVLPGLETLTWSSRGTPPGAFPAFVSEKPFKSIFTHVRLYSAKGEVVDEVQLRPSLTAPGDGPWRGSPVTSTQTNFYVQRVGDANHFRNMDWATNPPSVGALNPGLRVPWKHAGKWSEASPGSVSVTNGSWTGFVTLPAHLSGIAVLKADDGAGVSGTSSPFEVIPLPSLELAVPGALQLCSESTPGDAGVITVSVPAPVSIDLELSLSLSETNEFTVPSTVIIPAGTNSTGVVIRNNDDSIADGDAYVELAVSAPGYSPATATLLNADDEVGVLGLFIPSPLNEDSGFAAEQGRVFLAGPATHDVLVKLSADSPLEVPSSVIVPAGRLSQVFSVRVGNDGLVNAFGKDVKVRASMTRWVSGEGSARLLDDEDSRFSLNVPAQVVEGIPTTGQIQVATPHQSDVFFSLTSTSQKLQVPANVLLPAGAMSTEFTMHVPNNSVPDNYFTARLCVQAAGKTNTCKDIQVTDDEVKISRLVMAAMPGAVFSGDLVNVSATLVNASGTLQRTNGTGQVDLVASPAAVQWAGVTNPIPFTNGAWSSAVTFLGETLDAQLTVSALGYRTDSGRFDVVKGRQISVSLLDAVWHEGLGKFLVTEAAQTNVPARLAEIDPLTGERGRSLDLPRRASRIALSGDGEVAWLIGSQSTLLRVDLVGWKFDQEFSANAGVSNTDVRDIVVLAGERERIVAAVFIDAIKYLMLFDHGVGSTNRLLLHHAVFSTVVPALTAGRTPSEIFCVAGGLLSRVLVSSDGLELDQSVQVAPSSGPFPSVILSNDLLYCGNGLVFSAGTLQPVLTYATLSQLGVPFPEAGAVLFLQQNRILHAYDLASATAMGSHSLPAAVGAPSRLLRWGERGLASFNDGGSNLITFETPLAARDLPDLRTSVNAPEIVLLPTNSSSGASWQWQISVTNSGPGAAHGTQLTLDSGERFELGTIPPGEGTTIVVQRGSFTPKVIHARIEATCLTRDAAPSNNVSRVVTRVQSMASDSSAGLGLGSTHLLASPDGEHLYVAVSQSAGDAEDAVVIVDPGNARIERRLLVGENPQRLALSDDGKQLYVILGTNMLTRWNVDSATQEMLLTFTNETILDLLPLSASATSFVVATTARVAVFDNSEPRPSSYAAAANQRNLIMASGVIWLIEPGQIVPLSLDLNGLTGGTPKPFSAQGGNYRAATDGRYLYFSGAVFDSASGQTAEASYVGDQFCADASNSSLFSVWGACFRCYSLPTFTLQGEQCLPQTMFALQDPVRWGTDGLAVRSEGQLWILRSPLVPSNAATDLSVSIIPPASSPHEGGWTWTVTLTNRSAQPALRAILSVKCLRFSSWSVDGPITFSDQSGFVADAGEMPPHTALTFSIGGTPLVGDVVVAASVLAAGSDLTPADDSATATVNVRDIEADRGIHSVSAPTRVQVGSDFEASFVYTNVGPDTMPMTQVSLVQNPGLEFLGVVDGAYPTNKFGPLLGKIAPGEGKAVTLRYRATRSGLLTLSASAEGNSIDTNGWNNRLGALVYSEPSSSNATLTELDAYPSDAILAWDRSRQQLLAAFPTDFRSLFVLNPATAEPVARMTMPGCPRFIVPCQNGRHVWVVSSEGPVVRVDLNTMSPDMEFSLGPNTGYIQAAATPISDPNLLLLATSPWLGVSTVQVFDRGIPRPVTVSGPFAGPATGNDEGLAFTSDGRLFYASVNHLRELRITPSGLEEVANLDSLADYNRNSLVSVSNRLFYVTGRRVDLDTGSSDYPHGQVPFLAADPETSRVYASYPGNIPGPTLPFACFDAITGTPVLQFSLTLLGPTSLGSIWPMGTNGIFLLADKLRIFRPQLTTPAADLQVRAVLPSTVQAPGLDFPVQIIVTNASFWSAHQARLAVELPPELTFADGYPGTGTNYVELELGSLNGSTNVSLLARASTHGLFAVGTMVTGSVPDPITTNNLSQPMLTVLPLPVAYLDSEGIPEGSFTGSSRMAAWLSRPAPYPITLGFAIEPITAQADDFVLLAGQFQFAAGQQKATQEVLWRDSVPEIDETARFLLSVTNAALATSSALITILNDDFPRVSMSDVSIKEGDSGHTNAVFKATLSSKAPFPVEVLFRTIPVSAKPEEDFVPREGWLRFGPGEDTTTLEVPVLGDTQYEPSEKVAIAFLDVLQGEFGFTQPLLTILNDDQLLAPRLSLRQAMDGSLRLEFEATVGASYQLESKAALTGSNWEVVSEAFPGDGQPVSIALPEPTSGAGYYRVRVR